jgi:hypothetical protein
MVMLIVPYCEFSQNPFLHRRPFLTKPLDTKGMSLATRHDPTQLTTSINHGLWELGGSFCELGKGLFMSYKERKV